MQRSSHRDPEHTTMQKKVNSQELSKRVQPIRGGKKTSSKLKKNQGLPSASRSLNQSKKPKTMRSSDPKPSKKSAISKIKNAQDQLNKKGQTRVKKIKLSAQEVTQKFVDGLNSAKALATKKTKMSASKEESKSKKSPVAQSKVGSPSALKKSTPKEDPPEMDMNDLIRSLIEESSVLKDLLNCSLKLMELFDQNAIVDCVIDSYHKSCQGDLRFWRLADMPIMMGSHNKPLPKSAKELNRIYECVMLASESPTLQISIEGIEFFVSLPYILEVVELPKKNPFGLYAASLYFRHILRALSYLKDRLVIAKAFNEIKDILELKTRVENGLHDIKDHSGSSIAKIAVHLEAILDMTADFKQEHIEVIESVTMKALSETQVGDLTNQKIFASLHNLESLFLKLTESLDPESRTYFESLAGPVKKIQVENVASNSIVEGAQVDQSNVDDLLASLGL